MCRTLATLRAVLAPRLAAVALACCASALASCATAVQVAPEGRETVIRSLARQSRYLRVAVYVSPFFDDPGRVLLSDRPVEELGALQGPDGAPVIPPPPRRVLLPGTPVFVDTVQFPTGSVLWKRSERTPRRNPWVLAWADGESRPAVLLLTAGTGRAEDLLAEAGRVLTEDDPTPLLRELPGPQQDAVRRKELLEGMSRAAASMAWGFPDRMVIDQGSSTEEWSWGGGDRKATFQDDRLVRFTRKVASPPPRSADAAPTGR
jgi:hypothetical protein